VIIYLDTSALAKLFISEPGSGAVAAAVSSALAVATHRITYVEIHATLARAARMGRIQASSLDHRLRDFETRWASLDVVDLTDPMARRAAELAIRYGLRGYDSVHLAAALAVQAALAGSEPVTFGASDLRLTEAAKLAGLSLLPLL
jgi:predicted nucleic acid-binding protein